MGHQRPTTRSKNKRTRADDNDETTTQILWKIMSHGKVTEEDINQLYMIWKPVCQGCRVNTKDNPNCFCGLIPPLHGSRKLGLWQKTSEILNSLGTDLSDDLRACANTPAGLTNLGATCYANSILQCLYMNKPFREGVFSVEAHVLDGDPVLNNLARLFALLHSSKMAFVDSAPFIQTLELDNGVQQDSHEFLTLLLSLLEQCFSRSAVPKSRTIVQDLFRGGISHVTRCSRCGNESEASSKIEDFYELELNIQGLNSLDDSLDDYLSAEELQGENQYYCSVCAMHVDANRCIKLRSLPALLNFQLKRCIFLPNTTTKKKITSAFHFPVELDMARRLTKFSQGGLVYDLTAVLIHKGSAVNSGHYVAQIKNEKTCEWWEFDDEQVSNLGIQPFASTSFNVSSKAVEDQPAKGLRPAEFICPDSHTSAFDANQMPSSSSRIAKNGRQTFSSTEAYMLMYALRKPSVEEQNITSQFNGHKMGTSGSEFSQENDTPLPSHLSKHVGTLNSEILDSCERYNSRKESTLNRIMKRREEVRSIISKAPVSSLEKPYFWISTEWLRQWADSVTPESIKNANIQCSHGKVPPSMVNSMKRLSAEAWSALFSQCEGGPVLNDADHCKDCIFEMCHGKEKANRYRDQRLSMRELAEAALGGQPSSDGKLYYVSKSWLQQWLRRKNIDSPSDADSEPTASIRCPHGELMPENAPGAKRILISETLWSFIHQIAMTVKPGDSVGCSAFFSDAEPCAICSVVMTEAAFSEDSLREFKMKQRQNHEKLVNKKNIVLHPDANYYLLPSSWLSRWRNYINTSGKSACSIELDALSSVIDTMYCEKHHKLRERPPELFLKRDQIFHKPADEEGLTLVAVDDWRLLCEEWGGNASNCIKATIVFDVGVEKDVIDSHEVIAISENGTDIANEVSCSSNRPVLKTSPEVCEECIAERESTELMKKLSYINEDIHVCLIRGKEPPKSILKASRNALDRNRRTSKRSRKAAYGNSVNLTVSSTTTVYQLKMMIWESFGVIRENQVLHKGSTVIEEDTAFLADVNIFPGDVLWITDSKIHENRDIADELSDHHMDLQTAEKGFRGTLLASAVSSKAQCLEPV